MRLDFTFFLLMMSATTVIAQQELVPPERQEEYTRVTSDLFLANACAKRLGWKDIYSNATDVFVNFAKQNNFPDAENLARKTATEIAGKVDGSQQTVSEKKLHYTVGKVEGGRQAVAVSPSQRSGGLQTSLTLNSFITRPGNFGG